MAIGGSVWGTAEELLHPRGFHGRWIKKWSMGRRDAAKILGLLSSMRIRTFPSDAAAGQYAFNQHHKGLAGKGKGLWDPARFFHDFNGTNAVLRQGKSDTSTQHYVDMMDGSSVETDSDLIAHMNVGPEAFGLTAEDLVRRPDPQDTSVEVSGVENMTGKLIADRGFTSMNIGTPAGANDPAHPIHVVVAVPKGTKAVFPGTSTEDRQMVLGPNQGLRITKVKPNGQGGYYAYAVVVDHQGEGDHLNAPEVPGMGRSDLTPQQREQRLTDLASHPVTREQRGVAEQIKKEQENPPPQGTGIPEQPQAAVPQQQPVAPAAPGGPAPRTEALAHPNLGGGAPAQQAPELPATPQAPTPPEAATPAHFLHLIRDDQLPIPSRGSRRAEWKAAVDGITKGKHPGDVLRELDTDIAVNKRKAANSPGADLELERDIQYQEKLADTISENFNVPRRKEEANADILAQPRHETVPEPGAPEATAAERHAAEEAKKPKPPKERPKPEEKTPTPEVTMTPEMKARIEKRRAPGSSGTTEGATADKFKEEQARRRAARAGIDELTDDQILERSRKISGSGDTPEEKMIVQRAAAISHEREKAHTERRKSGQTTLEESPAKIFAEPRTPKEGDTVATTTSEGGTQVGKVANVRTTPLRPIKDPHARARAWGQEHGFKGDSTGWMTDPSDGKLIQGWGKVYDKHKAEIDKWEVERLRAGSHARALADDERAARGERIRSLRDRARQDLKDQGFDNPSSDMLEEHMATLRRLDEQQGDRARTGGGGTGLVNPSGRPVGKPAEGKQNVANLQPGDRIMVQKDSEGNWVPATSRRDATIITVSGREPFTGHARPGRRSAPRSIIVGHDDQGNEIKVNGSAQEGFPGHQTFKLEPKTKEPKSILERDKEAAAKAAAPKAPEAPSAPEPHADLKGTKADLTTIARHEGVKVTSKMTKADIVDAIKAKRAQPTPETHKLPESAVRGQQPLNEARAQEFRTAWDSHFGDSIDNRSAREIADEVAAGNYSPDEGLRRLENDIDLNKSDLAEVEAELRRTDIDPSERPSLGVKQALLKKDIAQQEKVSKFWRQHFTQEPVVSDAEIEKAVPSIAANLLEPNFLERLRKEDPEELRTALRDAGHNPRGDTSEEIFNNALRDTITQALQERKAEREAKKVKPEAQAPGVGYESPQVRNIAEGLDISDHHLDRIQAQLDDPKKTPAAVGRSLDQFLRGPGSPLVQRAYMSGVNKDNNLFPLSPESEAKLQDEMAKLQHEGDQLGQLAERLKATRRKRATAPKPEPAKLDAPEAADATRISRATGIPRAEVAKRMTETKDKNAPASDWAKGQVDLLGTATSREQGAEMLKGKTKRELEDIAKAAKVHVGSKDTKDTIAHNITHHVVGRRLGSDAVTREEHVPRFTPEERAQRLRDLGVTTTSPGQRELLRAHPEAGGTAPKERPSFPIPEDLRARTPVGGNPIGLPKETAAPKPTVTPHVSSAPLTEEDRVQHILRDRKWTERQKRMQMKKLGISQETIDRLVPPSSADAVRPRKKAAPSAPGPSAKKLTTRELSALPDEDIPAAIADGRVSRAKGIERLESSTQRMAESLAIRNFDPNDPSWHETDLGDNSVEKQTLKIFESYTRNKKLLAELGAPRTKAEPWEGEKAGVPHSVKPIIPNTWGDFGRGRIGYHADGEIGMAIRDMGDSERHMSIDGEPLENALGFVATDLVRGNIDSPEALRRFKAIHAKMGAGKAKDRLAQAIERLDKAPAEIDLPDGTPQPLVDLAETLRHIPLAAGHRVGGSRGKTDELDAVRQLADEIAAGKWAGRPTWRVADELQGKAWNRRHESQEGKLEIDRAVTKAVDAIKALGPKMPGAKAAETGPSDAAIGRMSIPDMRALAVSRGIAGAADMNKDALLEALLGP